MGSLDDIIIDIRSISLKVNTSKISLFISVSRQANSPIVIIVENTPKNVITAKLSKK